MYKTKLKSLSLIFYKKGKVVQKYHPHSQTRIFAKLTPYASDRIDFDRAYLRVNYKSDYVNEGYYDNLKDLRKAAKDFLEAKYIREVLSWE